MNNYSKVLEFFMENSITLNKEQLEELKENKFDGMYASPESKERIKNAIEINKKELMQLQKEKMTLDRKIQNIENEIKRLEDILKVTEEDK